MDKEQEWTLVVKPQASLFDLKLRDLWEYRDLIVLFVRRDFVSIYKQTILGPLWYIIQPILTALTLSILGSLANINTGGVPFIVFYLVNIVVWNYFASCLTKTSNTFVANAGMFGKVYFPRLAVPLSVVISTMISFLIQFVILLLFLAIYPLFGGNYAPNVQIEFLLLIPALLCMMGGLGLGLGLLISSLTTKYRDLSFLVVFGVQLLMYATPVIYPLASINQKYWDLYNLNPMVSIIETFRFILLGADGGVYEPGYLLYSLLITLFLLLIGILLFNKTEKNFMDTV